MKYIYYNIDRQIFNDLPTGYLQNTVSIEEVDKLVQIITLTQDIINKNSTLALPIQFYGYAITLIQTKKIRIINCGEIKQTLNKITEKSQNNTYTIWWSNPYGWYGIYEIPENFKPIATNGIFTIYKIIQLKEK